MLLFLINFLFNFAFLKIFCIFSSSLNQFQIWKKKRRFWFGKKWSLIFFLWSVKKKKTTEKKKIPIFNLCFPIILFFFYFIFKNRCHLFRRGIHIVHVHPHLLFCKWARQRRSLQLRWWKQRAKYKQEQRKNFFYLHKQKCDKICLCLCNLLLPKTTI